MKNKKHIRIALEVDLTLQCITLTAIIICLIGIVIEESAFFLALFVLPILGIVQLVSVISFSLWLEDKVRIKYLISCLVYGILFIVVNFLLKKNAGLMIAVSVIVPVPMAVFYFWYSWRFYKINKDMLYDLVK